jgi:Type I phosphodiesterase / nucleotide pyrophosphatase
MLPIVRYGEASLADVLPSAAAALAVPGEPNVLRLAPARSVVLVLVDGLGWQSLQRNATSAPFLTGMAGSPLTAGFPATTVTSLTSLATGRPPGEHGLTGYSSYLDEVGAVVNWLSWRRVGDGADLRDVLAAETAQPHATVFQRVLTAGIATTIVSASHLEGSGLTRAALRGGRYLGTVAPGDVAAVTAGAIAATSPSLVYAYVAELDVVGHVRGADSPSWQAQLRLVDAFVEELINRLPPGVLVLVTGDHGMATVPDSGKIDYDGSADLAEGVTALAGEARARYVHVRAGALDDVLATWRERLAGRMQVLTREEAIGHGWFGPTVTDVARRRIGDVVAVADTPTAVVRRRAEPRIAGLVGHHGALTDEELLVPLLQHVT